MSEQFGKKWHAEYQDYRHHIALYHFDERHDGPRRIDVIFKVDETYKYGDWAMPSMTIQPKEAQQLMDELWRLGIRPAGADSSPNHIAALSAHLEDMRRLVLGPAVVQWPTFPLKP